MMNFPPQPGPHEFGGRAGDLRDQLDRLRVGGPIGDVEDLKPEVLAGVRAADEIVAAARVVLVVVDDPHVAVVRTRDSRNVPLGRRLGRIRDVDDRRPVDLRLPGNGIHLGLFAVRPVVRLMADVRPVPVRRVRPGRQLQRLAALQVVIADQPDVLRAVRHRIGLFSRGRGRGRTRRGGHQEHQPRGTHQRASGRCKRSTRVAAVTHDIHLRFPYPDRTIRTGTGGPTGRIAPPAGCPAAGRPPCCTAGSLRRGRTPCRGLR